MSIKLFECYGYFCAFYAIEVIVCFLTMVVGTLSLNISSPFKLCNWVLNCSHDSNEASSDAVLLTLLRCGTILYVYFQLKKVFKSGSAFVVGILCSYTVFSVLTFTITIVHVLQKDLVVVSSALPVFLLVADIFPAIVLTQHCLTVKSIESLENFVSEGMGILMPIVTLDAIMQLLLLINIGGYFQIRQLQQLSCFACVAVIINYIVFSTFVPACLTLYLTISNKNSYDKVETKPSWYDVRFVGILQKKHLKKNIISHKKKILLCFSLLVLHCIRLSEYHVFTSSTEMMQRQFDSIFTMTSEQLFTAALILILCSKYLLDDYEIVSKFTRSSDDVKEQQKLSLQLNSNFVTEAQTADCNIENCTENSKIRTPAKCLELLLIGSDLITDEEIITLVRLGKIPAYKLESVLQDANRGVSIRRQLFVEDMTNQKSKDAIFHIPHDGYDFTTATKACCENTIGFIPVPIGLVGPLLLNNQTYKVPMATTEGTLVASTNRGLKALFKAGGVTGSVYDDGMTRAPVVGFSSSKRCVEVATWLKDSYNFSLVKEKFDETSRYARLKGLRPNVSGRLLFIRFTALTGDAMGMNMVSKGTENALRYLHYIFNMLVNIARHKCFLFLSKKVLGQFHVKHFTPPRFTPYKLSEMLCDMIRLPHSLKYNTQDIVLFFNQILRVCIIHKYCN